MSEKNRARDLAIKLFGKTIPLLPNAVAGDRTETEEIAKEKGDKGGGKGGGAQENDDDDEEQQQEAKETEEKTEKDQVNADTREIKDADVDELSEPTSLSSKTNESSKTHPGDKETDVAEDEDQSGAGNSKDKTPKKPDKILPCPRCNSLETKFCYFNNYNINQPRHFCKNCQRYWTAGGTMRNVPVGAGRRKNKSSASRYRHLTVPEALHAAHADASEAIHHSPLKPHGTVLTFGMDAPLCESMASVLNLADKSMGSFHHRNGFHRAEEQRMAVSLGAENGEELSSGSSVTASTSSDKSNGNLPDPAVRNGQVFPPQMPFFGGAPWPYPWNSAHWGSPVAPPPPPFYPSTLPVPFYPATPYWACTVPGTWSVPWVPPPSSAHNAASSSNSPRLGKHPREGEPLKDRNEEKDDGSKQNSSERCLWIPKTLRIDDPGEAARSSIWATLGIKNDSSSGGGLFNAFQSKPDDRNHTAKASQVLQANPAALSRSRNFHESS